MTVAEILADVCTTRHLCVNAALLREEWLAASDNFYYGNGTEDEVRHRRRVYQDHLLDCQPIR